MKYYIGVDGGASKTAVCSASIKKLNYVKAAGTSWRENGVTKAAEIIKNAVYELTSGDLEGIAGMAMGLPCFGESIEGDRALKQALSEAFGNIPIYLTNDVEVGWAGSLALEPGINVVAGTGSIAFGKDNHGNTARSGGWSELFGDEGSCYWVGRKVMEIFSKQSDGRLPKDELFSTVCEEFGLKNGLELIDLIYYQYANSRESVASFQILAQKAASVGAPSAIALYSEAVQELCLLVEAVRNKLNFGNDTWSVSYSGGLFNAGDFVLPQFKSEIEKKGGKLKAPEFTPVQGAVLLAFQNFCPDDLQEIQKLMKGARQNDTQL